MNLLSQANELLEKIYKDLQTIKDDIIEIKLRLLDEEDITEEELREIKEGKEQIRKGEYTTLEEFKKELG